MYIKEYTYFSFYVAVMQRDKSSYRNIKNGLLPFKVRQVTFADVV